MRSNHARALPPLLFALAFSFAARGADSLGLPADYAAVVTPCEASVAVAAVNDPIPCDDEAYALQNYLQRQGVFYDVVLAAPDDITKYHGCDAVVSGTIAVSAPQTQADGPGALVSVGTFGFYYLLGFGYKTQSVKVDYRFDVVYPGSGLRKQYAFSDVRSYCYGIYGPAMDVMTKPQLYDPGWAELLYLLCRDLKKEGAGK